MGISNFLLCHTYNHCRKQVPQGAEGETNPRVAQLKSMFSRLAGADNEIDSEELQDILTASLSKGMCQGGEGETGRGPKPNIVYTLCNR